LVGYCTLYGDTVGSIAPIGDVYKTEVYELANYINREGEIIPNGIIEREPTAELSPGQKDTDVLPSYDILDLILDGYEANWELGKIFSRIKSTPEGIKQAFKLETVTAVLDRIKKNKFKAAQCPSALKWRNK
jgi:NAD+ synthase (glutamine-hydrolysing)